MTQEEQEINFLLTNAGKPLEGKEKSIFSLLLEKYKGNQEVINQLIPKLPAVDHTLEHRVHSETIFLAKCKLINPSSPVGIISSKGAVRLVNGFDEIRDDETIFDFLGYTKKDEIEDGRETTIYDAEQNIVYDERLEI